MSLSVHRRMSYQAALQQEYVLPVVPLSWREQRVLDLLARRRTNAQIASELCVSLSAVKNDVREIFSKLGAENRRQAVSLARLHGLISTSLLIVPSPSCVPTLPVGWRLLSAREQEIALFLTHSVVAGYTESVLAAHLDISTGTLKKHLQRIYHKLRVSNRASAVVLAMEAVRALAEAKQRGDL